MTYLTWRPGMLLTRRMTNAEGKTEIVLQECSDQVCNLFLETTQWRNSDTTTNKLKYGDNSEWL